ncbi:MAG: hypothetical protein GF333_05250 [Candidatus Omnitrophica bacterium]|nr:hypothetical protein [Candidatus Omnitrophota bacterium]
MGNGQLEQELRQMVVFLRKGNPHEAVTRMPRVIAGLKSFFSSQKDSPSLRPAAIAVRSLVQSFQRRDFVFMADILEYEIEPLFSGK